jgi:uncharacterized protein (DUF433 family)
MKTHHELGPKGKKLLTLLVGEISRGRFTPRAPETFISYGEALDRLEIRRRGLAGQQLLREGLAELNEWTKTHSEIPNIAGLIIDKRLKKPGQGFAPSHGHSESDWETWWLDETAKAIEFRHWDRYVREKGVAYPDAAATAATLREGPDYRNIITLEPGKRGGKPCIRGLRITVADVLGWLASGMTHPQIRDDFPELTEEDIRACLAFAADREQHALLLQS